MVTVRQRRINELLGEELSMLIPGRMDDPDLTGIRITHAEVTQDLATAKVFYVAPEETTDTAVHAALDRAQGYLRGQLAGLGLRRVPRLVFSRDRVYEEGQRVLDILATLEHVVLDDDPTETAESGAADVGAADAGEAKGDAGEGRDGDVDTAGDDGDIDDTEDDADADADADVDGDGGEGDEVAPRGSGDG